MGKSIEKQIIMLQDELLQVYRKGGERTVGWWMEKNKEIDKLKLQLEDYVPFDIASHPDTEADGIVFCGKCGKMK